MKTALKPLVTATATFGALFVAAPAAAQLTTGGVAAPNFYIGAGVGLADFEDDAEAEDLPDVRISDDDTAYKFFGGYRWTENFGIEGGYRNFGEAGNGPFSVETDGFDVAGVGFLPVGPVDLFAKGGALFWDTDGSGGLPDDDGTDLMYGVGGQLNLGRLFLRLESEWFEMDLPEDTQMISGSVGWTF